MYKLEPSNYKHTHNTNFLLHHGHENRLTHTHTHTHTQTQTIKYVTAGLHVLSKPGTVSSGVAGTNSSESGVLGSAPPSNGDRYVIVNCSMNDVPYFLKYHHSNICSTTNNSDYHYYYYRFTAIIRYNLC